MRQLELSKLKSGLECEIELKSMQLDFEELEAPTNKQAKTFLMNSLLLLTEMQTTYRNDYNWIDKAKLKVCTDIFKMRLNKIKVLNETDLYDKEK